MLLLGLGVWKILEGIGNTVGVFLNVAGGLRLQLISAILMAISSILLKFFLIDVMGISGAIWATVISYTIFSALPLSLLIHKFVRRLTFVSGN